MGIRGLTTTFKTCCNTKAENCVAGIHDTSLQEIAQRHYSLYPNEPLRVAVDFMEVSHHWLGSNDEQFVANFCKFMILMFSCDICPVFCFDGKPATDKNMVIESRKAKREVYNEYLETLRAKKQQLILLNNYGLITDSTYSINDSIDTNWELRDLNRKIQRMLMRTRSVTPYHCTLIKTLLDCIGLQSFYFPDLEGGEMICVHLQRLGYVKYCMTNDLDVFPMGATWIIREFNFRTGQCQLYDRHTLMHGLGINSSRQFIDLCILHGCDLIERPIGLTSTRILELINEYGSIECILEEYSQPHTSPLLEDIVFPNDYDPGPSRQFFLTPILNEVRCWEPINLVYWRMLMLFKAENETKKRTIDVLQKSYPELNSYYNVICPLMEMLSTCPTCHE